LRSKGIDLNFGNNVRSQTFRLRTPADTAAIQSAAGTPKRNFVQQIATDPQVTQTLMQNGVTPLEINNMIATGARPTGWQVHHKKPVQWGGDNSQTNFVLIKNDPYHRSLAEEQGLMTGQLEALGLSDQPGSNEFEINWIDLPGSVFAG
jgi:hypothetical protein